MDSNKMSSGKRQDGNLVWCPSNPYPSVNFLSSEVKKVEMPEFTG
jgi:hypothetical protein